MRYDFGYLDCRSGRSQKIKWSRNLYFYGISEIPAAVMVYITWYRPVTYYVDHMSWWQPVLAQCNHDHRLRRLG